MIQVNTQETIDCPMKISEVFRENPCDPSPSKSNPQLFPAASRMSFAWGPPYPVTPLLSTSVWRAARWWMPPWRRRYDEVWRHGRRNVAGRKLGESWELSFGTQKTTAWWTSHGKTWWKYVKIRYPLVMTNSLRTWTWPISKFTWFTELQDSYFPERTVSLPEVGDFHPFSMGEWWETDGRLMGPHGKRYLPLPSKILISIHAVQIHRKR